MDESEPSHPSRDTAMDESETSHSSRLSAHDNPISHGSGGTSQRRSSLSFRESSESTSQPSRSASAHSQSSSHLSRSRTFLPRRTKLDAAASPITSAQRSGMPKRGRSNHTADLLPYNPKRFKPDPSTSASASITRPIRPVPKRTQKNDFSTSHIRVVIPRLKRPLSPPKNRSKQPKRRRSASPRAGPSFLLSLPQPPVRRNPARTRGTSSQSSEAKKVNYYENSDDSDSDSTIHGSVSPSKRPQAPTQGKSQPKSKKLKTSHFPKLSVSDLFKIQESIKTLTIPSWMTRISPRLGIPGSGKLKAAEWLVLYTVYMVLITIPDLSESPNSDNQIVCESIILLVKIVNCAFSRSFDEEQGRTLQFLLQTYRHHIQTHWPNVSDKPNQHIAQHLSDIATLFGPPCYTACWVGERMNGYLIKVPTNHHLGRSIYSFLTQNLCWGNF